MRAKAPKEASEQSALIAWANLQRKPWLNSIGEKRGRAAQKYLEDEVIRQHQLKREAA